MSCAQLLALWPGCLHLKQSRDFFGSGAEGVVAVEELPVAHDIVGSVADDRTRCVEGLASGTSGLGQTLFWTSSEQYSEILLYRYHWCFSDRPSWGDKLG